MSKGYRCITDCVRVYNAKYGKKCIKQVGHCGACTLRLSWRHTEREVLLTFMLASELSIMSSLLECTPYERVISAQRAADPINSNDTVVHRTGVRQPRTAKVTASGPKAHLKRDEARSSI
eukprot:3895186-Pleurochrysis_carterae.AAC.3